MSSMRNAVSRRPHKERSQPKGREKWGILEKHKDYSLRARDYNVKKQKLAALSQKARNRNEDEYAFGMSSANKAEAGKHGRGNAQANRLSHDTVKLLKSQDVGYLRVVAGRGRREIGRLEEEVEMAEPQGKAKKVVFVDENGGANTVSHMTERAGKRWKLDVETAGDEETKDKDGHSKLEAEHMAPAVDVAVDADNIDLSAVKATTPKPKKVLAAEHYALRDLRAARKRRKRLAELRVAKLEALKKRQREIMAAADELELQRARMARTVGGVNKDGVKWKIRERKR